MVGAEGGDVPGENRGWGQGWELLGWCLGDRRASVMGGAEREGNGRRGGGSGPGSRSLPPAPCPPQGEPGGAAGAHRQPGRG